MITGILVLGSDILIFKYRDRDPSRWEGHRKVYDQMTKYVTDDNDFWRCPSDKVIWNDPQNVFFGIKVTSYAWARTCMNSFTGYWDTPAWKLSDVKRPSTSALFGDGCWELSTLWLPLWHSRGYNVGFVDGHVGHYRDNGIQGRVRKDW
jgi:prepilin-type processing-associated H-X9-DG protein